MRYWWEEPEWARTKPMNFSDPSGSQTIRVRKIGCLGTPNCLCGDTRIYSDRPYRVEVACGRELPDEG